MDREAARSEYDVVVVGSGIGGLTCGAFLARAGKRVLVVEREERVGGFARDFQHGPYRINPAIHLIWGGGATGPGGRGLLDAVLGRLGVRARCDFSPVETFYRVQLPRLQMDVPADREAYVEAHQRMFPRDAGRLSELVNLCSRVFAEFVTLPIEPGVRDWALMPFRQPKLFRYANATLASATRRYLGDSRLRAAYTALWPYVGLPPSRASFAVWATMMSGYLDGGAFICRGGFQQLADAIATGLTEHGGELISGVAVTRIHADGGRVSGISLDNGQRLDAATVVSNIDARVTFQELLEPGRVPRRYLGRLGRLEPSLSVLGLHLATDLDVHALGVPKVTIVAPWEADSVYHGALSGQVNGVGIHVPTVCDSTLAPPGEHLVIVQAFVPARAAGELSPSDRSRFAERLLAEAERVLPGLRDHITFVEPSGVGPADGYPLHRQGPIYGWAAVPRQAGPRRLLNRTPVEGLYLTGHWTQPGHGIWAVALSGLQTARLVLGERGSDSLWPFDAW
jgi:prolycopene isomerase